MRTVVVLLGLSLLVLHIEGTKVPPPCDADQDISCSNGEGRSARGLLQIEADLKSGHSFVVLEKEEKAKEKSKDPGTDDFISDSQEASSSAGQTPASTGAEPTKESEDPAASAQTVEEKISGMLPDMESYGKQRLEVFGNKWLASEVASASFALFWIMLLVTFPLSDQYFAGKKASMTQSIHTFMLITWILSGFTAFRYVIEFESGHWEGRRCLSLIESCYLMAQVITTVGYGDIGPCYAKGRLFLGFWVLMGIALIADMISSLGDHIADSLDRKIQRIGNLLFRVTRWLVGGVANQGELSKLKEAERIWDEENVRRPHDWLNSTVTIPYMPLAKSILFYTFVSGCGILFMHFSREAKPFHEAVYMSIITLSTVGFGFCTPHTDVGMAFSTFWMVIGSWALLNAINKFRAFTQSCRTWASMFDERRKADFQKNIAYYTDNGITRVDRYEFMKVMLVHARIIEDDQLHQLEIMFRACNPDQYQTVDLKAVYRNAFQDWDQDDWNKAEAAFNCEPEEPAAVPDEDLD